MISESHLTYFFKKPRIPKSLLMKYREGIIVGSACVMGELMEAVLEERSDEVLSQIVDFYDYLEIQPRDNNRFLLESPRMQDKYPQIRTEEDLLNLNRTIVRLGELSGKPVVPALKYTTLIFEFFRSASTPISKKAFPSN